MSQQLHKAIYFDDYQSDSGKNKSFTIAFNEDEAAIYKKIRVMSSYEIKRLIECQSYAELKGKADADGRPVNQYVKRVIGAKIKLVKKPAIQTKDVTFGNSKDIPFQRWYPYIEGYSPNFVKSLVQSYCPNAELIYEPFAGTGTTLFTADMMGIDTVYSEVNPLLRYLIKAKIEMMQLPSDQRILLANELRVLGTDLFSTLSKHKPNKQLKQNYFNVFGKSVYFPEDQLDLILRLRTYIDSLMDAGKGKLAMLLDIAVFSCLIPVSYLKKQGDLRFKTEKEKLSEMQTLQGTLPRKLKQIVEDVENLDFCIEQSHQLLSVNAKNIGSVTSDRLIDAVITSPPYLNGTNYFRNTKLELWFLGYLETDKDLRTFRDEALTSGINDVKLGFSEDSPVNCSKTFNSTIVDLEDKAYDRRIPVMAKCYFNEMYEVFSGLTNHLRDNADILVDLGDSIFSGVHIPTDKILVETINAFGFILKKRIVLRQRRSRNGELLSQVLLVIKYNKKS